MSFFDIFKTQSTKLWNLADVNKDGKVSDEDLKDDKCKRLNEEILKQLGVDQGREYTSKDAVKNEIKNRGIDISDFIKEAKEKSAEYKGKTKQAMGLENPSSGSAGEAATGAAQAESSGEANAKQATSAAAAQDSEEADEAKKSDDDKKTDPDNSEVNETSAARAGKETEELKVYDDCFKQWKANSSDEDFNRKMEQQAKDNKQLFVYQSATHDADYFRNTMFGNAPADFPIASELEYKGKPVTKKVLDEMPDSAVIAMFQYQFHAINTQGQVMATQIVGGKLRVLMQYVNAM